MAKSIAIIFPNSADGLASAALFKSAIKENILLFPSNIPRLSDSIIGIKKKNVSEIHLLGIGVNEEIIDSVLESFAATGLNRSKIFWYFGRGYIDGFEKQLQNHCTPIFSKEESNTKQLAKSLNSDLQSKICKHLLDLALEYKHHSNEAEKFICKVDKKWHDLAEAFSETGYLTSRLKEIEPVVDRLSLSIEWSKEYDLLIDFFNNCLDGYANIARAKSASAKEIRNTLIKYAKTDEPVFITGETGTGKELAASFVHYRSNRSDHIFLPINCADFAGNPTMARSELFGYKKGAFTGANEDKAGAFEVCNGGTLFLDEFCELPIDIQTMLLRTLESKQVRPVGSNEVKKIDVRLIVATNKNVFEMVNNNTFREDLFYRTYILNVSLLPLRERKEDIIDTIYGNDYEYEISAKEKKVLLSYDWPGNFRELRNLVRKAIALDISIVDVVEEAKAIAENMKHVKSHSLSSDASVSTLVEQMVDLKLENQKLRESQNTSEFSFQLPQNIEEIVPLNPIIEEFKGAYIKRTYDLFGQNGNKTAEKLKIAINTCRIYLGLLKR